MSTSLTGQAGPARRMIEGTYNLRDVGGYPVAHGRRTRDGVLYRSDALHALTENGGGELRALGLRTIVDLRGDEELSEAPSAIDGFGIRVRHHPVFTAAAPRSQAMRPGGLRTIYDFMVQSAGSSLTSAVREFTRENAPVLVHCTAGKDRTGVVVALALEAVGVERESVIADYAASEGHLAGEWAAQMLSRFASQQLSEEVDILSIVTTSPASLMEQLLDDIDRDFGGARAYLHGHGMSDGELDALAEALTEDAATIRTTN